MTTKLRLAEDLELPHDAQTETFAFLARRGSGKTYAALVLAEELAGAGLRFVILDPVGVCWGLRSSANGAGPGVPIVVLGGEHGDLPLEVTAGELVADLIVDQGVSLVLDLSAFRKGEMVRFVTQFAETLYHRNRDPLHVILDEADAFAPQRPGPDQARCLGAIEDLVRRGRARGIGVSMLTQRPAVLNKDILTQAEVLVAMRTIGRHDRDAIAAWVEVHGDEKQLAALEASLPSMQPGEAWVWSPSWLGILKRIRFRQRRTFDSSRTPRAGEKRQSARVLAQVDLEALRGRMASIAATAAERDPKAIRAKYEARISELEAALEERPAAPPPEPEIREVSVLTPEDCLALCTAADRLEDAARKAVEAAGVIRAAAGRAEPVAAADPLAAAPRARLPRAAAAAAPMRNIRRNIPVEPGELSGPERKILDAIAWCNAHGQAAAPQSLVAFLAGYSGAGSSSYRNPRARLSTAGLIESRGEVILLTPAGARKAQAPARPPTRRELHERILRQIPGPEREILAQVLAAHPRSMDQDEVARGAGYAGAASSSYRNPRARLSTWGLVEYRPDRTIAAAAVLFP